MLRRFFIDTSTELEVHQDLVFCGFKIESHLRNILPGSFSVVFLPVAPGRKRNADLCCTNVEVAYHSERLSVSISAMDVSVLPVAGIHLP